jgi:hypothetical protein
MKREIVLQGGKAIMPTTTGTTQASDLPDQEIETSEPLKRSPHFLYCHKPLLLLFLLSGLATVFMLHFIALNPLIVPAPATTCAGLLHAANYPQLVDLQPQQEMQAVQVVNDLAGSSPTALVQVTDHNAQNALDVYVFGCVTRRHQLALTQLFSQRGLAPGVAEVTPEHTLTMETLDTRIPANDLAFLLPLQQNIYHEYAWRAGHFVQVLFPGFYPVTSQAEAEVLQQNFDQLQNMPWNNPVATALQMSKDLLHWTHAPTSQLVSQKDGTALVELKEQKPPIDLDVTLRQLIQPGQQGLWFVTEANTGGLLLSRSTSDLDQPFQSSVTSPIQLSGANALIDGRTTATLLDHTLMPVAGANNVLLTVNKDSTFSDSLTYAHLVSAQPGVLLIESMPLPENAATEPGQILLLSVLLN